MMARKPSQFLIVNGVEFPCPSPDLEIIHSQNVDAGRNANGAVIGQLVGRKMWKINNLHWGGLDAETWSWMKKALEPFFVKVTFTTDDNERHTITMYPSDVTAKPLFLTEDGIHYKNFVDCKFNLIDCGWNE